MYEGVCVCVIMCVPPPTVRICVFAFEEGAEERDRQASHSLLLPPLPLPLPSLSPIHVKNQSRVKTCLNFPCLCDYGVRESLTDLCATEASPRHLACHARLVRWRLPVKRL